MTSALIVLSLLAQQEFKVSRTAKDKYAEAVRKCDEAAKLVDSGPAEAIKLLDDAIGKVEKHEVKLRYPLSGGTYSEERIEFFPYHWRGRARVKLAESSGKDEKIKLLESGIEDLQKSVDAGVKASEAHLESARRALEETKRGGGPAVDPLPAFERGLDDLLSAAKFTDAKTYVESKGGFLSAEKRGEYVRKVEDKCREQTRWATDRFLEQLQALTVPDDVMRMSPAAFDRDFRLPAAESLVVSSAAHAWCAKARAALETMRARKDALDGLFDAAVEAVPLDEKEDNPWFAPVERLAWAVVEDDMRRRTDEAQSAGAEQRLKLRTEVEGLSKRWAAFQERLRKAAEGRSDFVATIPRRDAAAFLGRFPVDATGLDKIVAAIETSVHSEDPAKELTKVEDELRKMDRNRLTLESRRRVASYRVVAASLRGFLDGKSVDQLAGDLRDVADELRAAGGPVDDLKRYGQKVALVFERLR